MTIEDIVELEILRYEQSAYKYQIKDLVKRIVQLVRYHDGRLSGSPRPNHT